MQTSNLVFGSYLSPRSTANKDLMGASSLKNSGILSPTTPNRALIGSSAFESLQQVGHLSSEVERLNELNCALILENESLKARMDKSKREVELESKIKILATENERLNSLLAESRKPSSYVVSDPTNELVAEIAVWKEKYAQVEPAIIDLQDRLNQLMFERELEAEQLLKVEKDNESLKNRLADALDSVLLLTEDNKKLKSTIQTPRFEGSIGAIKNEIRESLGSLGSGDNADKERRQFEAEAKRKMVEEITRLRKDNEQKENEIRELRGELDMVGQLSKEMEEKFNELLEERITMNKNLQDFQLENERIAEQNVILEDDNKRLFEVINNVQTEKMELQNQLRNQINVVRAEDVQRFQIKISELQKQNQTIQEELKKAQSDVIAKDSEIEKLKKSSSGASEAKVQPFIEKINQLVEELRQTNTVIMEKNAQEGGLKKRIMELEKEKAINSEQMMLKMQQVLKELTLAKQEAKVRRQENEALCIEIRKLQSRSFENHPTQASLTQSLDLKDKQSILKESSKSIMNEVEGLRNQLEDFRRKAQSPYVTVGTTNKNKSELETRTLN